MWGQNMGRQYREENMLEDRLFGCLHVEVSACRGIVGILPKNPLCERGVSAARAGVRDIE